LGREEGDKESKDKQETNALFSLDNAIHSFQEEYPLIVVEKLKMHGLATLGQGLLVQKNIYNAMAKRIVTTLKTLKNEVNRDKDVGNLMSGVDISSVRCTFIDFLGPEEIGLLIFCRNYSVGVALASEMRKMTFGDVFESDKDGDLVNLFNKSKLHKSVIKLGRKYRGKKEVLVEKEICDNHVFRRTLTSLSFSPRLFFEEMEENCSGYVNAYSEYQISPGHRLNVESTISERFDSCEPKFRKDYVGGLPYHVYHIGTKDLIIPLELAENNEKVSLVPLEKIIKIDSDIFATFNKTLINGHGRDLVKMGTELSIPVPKLDGKKNKKKRHFSPLNDLLFQLQHRLFYVDEKEKIFDIDTTCRGKETGKMKISELKKIPKRYGVPVSLRRTMELMFSNYASLISNPNLFDSVIDLYDSFATLHVILTEYLPKERKNAAKKENTNFRLINHNKVERLSELVEGMHNALRMRVFKTIPEDKGMDLEVAFKGSLNQLIHAADVPVKCGLGLVRRYGLNLGSVERRDRVGGFTSIGFVPGAKCHSLNLGVEDKAKLAHYEVDVPHALHVASYLDNLHESFHIIYETIRSREGSEICDTDEEVMSERISEVFAYLLTHIFVFGRDSEKFAYSHLCNYSKSLVSNGHDDTETVGKFTELMIRLFLVVDGIPKEKDPTNWDDAWIRQDEKEGDALERFQRFVGQHGPFFSAYGDLIYSNKSVEKYCTRQFEEIYARMKQFMPKIWDGAVKIYKKYSKDELSVFQTDGANFLEELDNVIDQAFRKAEAINSFAVRNGEKNEIVDIDPLYLVTRLLYQYIPSMDGIFGKEIHLKRDKDNNKIEYVQDKDWYDFQIDKGFAAMFCPVPGSRKTRLRKQIVIIKTLWNLSTVLRARRLMEMLYDNWSDDAIVR